MAGADNENENTDLDDRHFVQTNYSEDEDNPFDDIVRMYSEEDLILPLAKVGQLKSKYSQSMGNLERAVHEIFGEAASSPPYNIPANLVVSRRDAWGDDFVYVKDPTNPYPQTNELISKFACQLA